jgi:enoyl-CoA hydratase
MDKNTKEVKVSHNGPITIISINRPHVKNAINKSTAQALKDAWLDFETDENALVGVMTGGDEVFCAGADLNDVDELGADIDGEMGPLGFTRLFVSKPTIAAVAGFCVAGGLEIACWCDLRISDETAVFGCFERRFGVPLVDGGTQRLPRIIGLGRALEMILTGKPVSAGEALASGLVNEVVAPGQSLKRAVELAQVLAIFPQMCMRNDRQAVYVGLGKELPEGLLIEARFGMETMKSGEPLTGSQEFMRGRESRGEFHS